MIEAGREVARLVFAAAFKPPGREFAGPARVVAWRQTPRSSSRRPKLVMDWHFLWLHPLDAIRR